jgi:hypothetical protein
LYSVHYCFQKTQKNLVVPEHFDPLVTDHSMCAGHSSPEKQKQCNGNAIYMEKEI